MLLNVVVTPKSSRESIEGLHQDAAGRQELSCRVRQAPEGGKATKAVCVLVARSLGIPKSYVRCVRGNTSRHKQLELDCPKKVVEDWLDSI